MSIHDWCVDATFTVLLPTGYADQITTTVAQFISRASDDLAVELEPLYWPFPDAGDAIPTPDYIQQTVAYLAAFRAHDEIGRADNVPPEENVESIKYYGLYQTRLAHLKESQPAFRVKVADEEMTFGSGELGDNEYQYDPGALTLNGEFEVIKDSVRVADHQRLEDFYSEFSEDDGAWLFHRKNTAIVDTDTVDYTISFLKGSWREQPSSIGTVELIVG